MASLLDLLGRAKKDKKVAYGDTTYLPINDIQSLNSQVDKYEELPTSLEKVLKKELKKPINGINDLFDKADRLIIDTRGVVNPYRTKILTEKFQSNTTVGGILKQAASLAGAILKQRTRIPDTIFPNLTKPGPISNTLLQPQNALRGELDINPKETYYVKTTFKPGAEILGSAARSAIAGDLRTAKQEALQAGLNLGRSKGRSNKQKYEDKFIQSSYHPAGFDLNLDGRIGGKKGIDNGEDGEKSFSSFKEYYMQKDGALSFNGIKTSNGYIKTLKERKLEEDKYSVDNYIDYLIYGMFPAGVQPDESLIPWVKMHPIGYSPVYFPGTITGLNENVQGTWETFKYIGSPFGAYKYNGVERTLSFTLNLYWMKKDQIGKIKEQIEFIKELCFPAPDVAVARYSKNQAAKNNIAAASFGMSKKDAKLYRQLVTAQSDNPELTDSDQLFYRPQFLELTIHGYANKLFGFMENITVNIPDNTTWPSININSEFVDTAELASGVSREQLNRGLKNTIYPSNLNIEITFKIIENPHARIDADKGKVSYRYNLDGMGAGVETKYPTRPAFLVVPEEDITKHDDVPRPPENTTASPAAKINTPKPVNKGNKKSKPSNTQKADVKTATNTDEATQKLLSMPSLITKPDFRQKVDEVYNDSMNHSKFERWLKKADEKKTIKNNQSPI